MRLRIILLIFWLTACTSDNKPKDLIAEDKMIPILTDIHVLESQVNDLHLGNSDSSLLVYQKMKVTALKKYGVDSVNFNRSLRYYIMNPGILKNIYVEVKKELEKKKKSIVAIKASQYTRGKSDSIARKDSAKLP
ncbi:MAG: DUF4296 domain-containing protein [Bacteroidota bacterium]|jgi:hypothetical protein